MGYRVNMQEYQNIVDIYCNLAEQCTTALRQFYYDIEENCRECRYKPMVDFVKQISDFYYGDFKSHLMHQFRDWEESRYSLDNLARSIGAGESAAAVGKQYMDQIYHALDGMFTGSVLEELGYIDTSEPEITNEMILRNREYIETFIRKAGNATEEAVDRTERNSSDNNAFLCIVGIVKTTGNSMVESFRNMLRQVAHGEELFNMGGHSSIDPAGEDTGHAINADGSMNWPFEDTFI